MPPQVNATLVRVSTARAAASSSPADDWDVDVPPAVDPDAGGPLEAGEKWSGRVPAYLRERVDRVVEDGALNLFTRRTLYVDTADLPAGVDTDDELVVELEDGATFTVRARTIAASRLAGVPARLATTRIDLEDA